MSAGFCSACGGAHVDPEFPKRCPSCGETAWGSPTSVVVVLQTVRLGFGKRGLVMAQRNIQPMRGGWAFMGGHVNRGESLEQGACREWFEETGRRIGPGDLDYYHSYPVADGSQTLAVFRNRWTLTKGQYESFKLCPENQGFGVLTDPEQIDTLCFPTHREVARRCYNEGWF